MERVNYITPAGYRALREEYEALYAGERPKLLETIAWAAANGDRSENADYLYGKKRLREIDQRLAHLAKAMKAAKIVDPASQAATGEVRFGATVELADDADNRRLLTIVGDDEADASDGLIGWSAPFARALIGAKVGDERLVVTPIPPEGTLNDALIGPNGGERAKTQPWRLKTH